MIGSPVRISSRALDLPTIWVSLTVPPPPGKTPSLISGIPSLAVSEQTRMSHISASSIPPPKAIPLIAPINGFLNFGIIRLLILSI